MLTVRTQVDNRGGIVAANDYDITKFARDTYSYVWPRDGALVANALDRSGHEDVTRSFFQFCQKVLRPEGYFAHKYAPDGQPGSSWHPWVDANGRRVLPIQEDETGLVLWSLWSHYDIHRNLDFAMQLYSGLVVPAGEWMAAYVDPRNHMIKPSWDLWEERWGVHAFSVGAVWAGLRGAANFAELYGDEKSLERFSTAAEELRHATDDWLWRPELDRFARRLTVAPDGSMVADNVLDSAIYGLWRFGMYEPTDNRIVKTMTAIKEQLSNKGATGGVARYTNDYYFQVEHDLSQDPGQPLVHLHPLAGPVVHRDRDRRRPAGAGAGHHRLGRRPQDGGGDALRAGRPQQRRAALGLTADLVTRRVRGDRRRLRQEARHLPPQAPPRKPPATLG